MIKYNQEILGEFAIDHEYESFVRGWMAYHRAANSVDGHLPPSHPDQVLLGRLAVRAGWDAMIGVLGFAGHNPFCGGLQNNADLALKWQQAKLEAIRRVEREKEGRGL